MCVIELSRCTWTVLATLAGLALHSGSVSAEGPPVQMIDLSKTQLAQKAFRDCQLHVRSTGRAYELHTSEAVYSVARVVLDRDKMYAILPVKATLAGLPISELVVPFVKSGPFLGLGGSLYGQPNDRVRVRTSQYFVRVRASQRDVVDALRTRTGARFTAGTETDGPEIDITESSLYESLPPIETESLTAGSMTDVQIRAQSRTTSSVRYTCVVSKD
jgi:hypothetical protein